MRIAATVAAALILMVPLGSASGSSPLLGQWKTDDGKAIMEIAPCGGGLCAKIVRFLIVQPAGGARDTKNPDKSLRTRPLLGVNVLTGLVADGNAWKGKGYSPEEGRHFNATVTLSGAKLNLKGCVSLFCRNLTWTRVK